MPWSESNRRGELPANWVALRRRVKARAHGQCQAILQNGRRCQLSGTDCDHIADPMDHSLVNLQWLCAWHHQQKTAREAAQALAEQRARNADTVKKHPGLVG